MNKDTLVSKHVNWSMEKVKNFFSGAQLPDTRFDFNKISEYADDGLYVIGGASARFLKNDGTILTLIRAQTEDPKFKLRANDFDVLKKLYDASLSDPAGMKFAELLELTHISIDGALYEYRHWRSPNNQLGIPMLAEQYAYHHELNSTFLKEYIDEIAWLIHTLKKLNCPYPAPHFTTKVFWEQRMRIESGHYYYDIREFYLTHNQFLNIILPHFKSLPESTNSKFKRRNIMAEFQLDDFDAVVDYAESRWKI